MLSTGLRGLGAGPVNDWVLANCTNLNGDQLYCDYSPSLGVAWNDGECDPNQSSASGVCTDSSGTAVPNISPIISVASSVSGRALTAPAAQGTLAVTAPLTAAQIATGALTPAQALAQAQGNYTTVIPTAPCSKTLISGVCDIYLLFGVAGMVLLLGVAKR